MNYLIICLMFISFLGASPSFVAGGQEKPKGAIQSEWPEMDFSAAYDYFEKKDFSRASQEIKQGADFLKAASEHAEGEIKKDLRRSYGELERLSDEVKKGAVKSSARLRQAFSRAHQALAEYYHERFKDSWLRRDTEKAGRELKSAALNLERGIAWAGGEVEKTTGKVIRESRGLGERLARKAEWSVEEVEKETKEVGEELKKLEDKISWGRKRNKE